MMSFTSARRKVLCETSQRFPLYRVPGEKHLPEVTFRLLAHATHATVGYLRARCREVAPLVAERRTLLLAVVIGRDLLSLPLPFPLPPLARDAYRIPALGVKAPTDVEARPYHCRGD